MFNQCIRLLSSDRGQDRQTDRQTNRERLSARFIYRNRQWNRKPSEVSGLNRQICLMNTNKKKYKNLRHAPLSLILLSSSSSIFFNNKVTSEASTRLVLRGEQPGVRLIDVICRAGKTVPEVLNTAAEGRAQDQGHSISQYLGRQITCLFIFSLKNYFIRNICVDFFIEAVSHRARGFDVSVKQTRVVYRSI